MTRISDAPVPYGTPRKPGISLDFVVPVESTPDLPPETRGRAMRAVASRARGAEDARLLLDAFGLLPAPATSEVTR